MRNQWRFLLQRCRPLSNLQFKVQSSSSSSHLIPQFHFPNPNFTRSFSSSSSSVITSSLIELYSDPIKSNEQVMLELKSNNDLASINQTNNVIDLFNSRGSKPESGKLFYNWVMSNQSNELSSNSCNQLLGMLGENGLLKEFWDLIEIMKNKGYGVKKGASNRAMAKFIENGLEEDVKKLRDLFVLGSVNAIDTSIEKVCARVCKVIRQAPWGDDVEKKLNDLGVVYSSDLVTLVLENLETDCNKAVIFFRWIGESGLFKHDENTYNAIARVLAREDYIDKFWRVIDEMKSAGFDLQKASYVLVLSRFVRKKMLKDAVDLYEFAMSGNVKPSVQDCVFLLRKIATRDELDMELFSKVLRVYKESGNSLTNTVLDTVLKSLTSVGKYEECNKILRAMEEVGFFPDENLQAKIGFQLSKTSKTDKASEFLDFIEISGTTPSYKTWESLIEGYCVSGHLDKACDCFQKLIKNEGPSCAGYALETLLNAYCSKENKNTENSQNTLEAYKLLSDSVVMKGVKPWLTTYKMLISKLIAQGLFKEATNLFAPMKANGYPPYIDPFVKYVATTGTSDDTVMFLNAMTNKKVPSTAVYTRVFKAYLKAGRHSQAQDLLAKCPRFIKNHVDVLNLFSSMKRVKDAPAVTPVAA